MKEITATKGKVIQFGYEGEDKVTILRFSYSDKWLENGEGIFNVRVLRNGENLNLIESAQNDDNPVRVILTNNYAQGVNALANTYTNLLVNFGNIMNNALVSGS